MPILKNVIELFYPNVCGFCGGLSKQSICPKCMINIKNSLNFKIEYNNKRKHIYLFKYEDMIRKNLIKYKFQDASYLNESFVKIILKNEKINEILKSYDIIIPVPISKKRKRQRGYNQSELIAKNLAKFIENMECKTNILEKIKDNASQSTLTKMERCENVKGVYKIKPNCEIIGKTIILFDDIYTTGSTANECCKVLENAGAKLVDIFTIAKD